MLCKARFIQPIPEADGTVQVGSKAVNSFLWASFPPQHGKNFIATRSTLAFIDSKSYSLLSCRRFHFRIGKWPLGVLNTHLQLWCSHPPQGD
ncbi:hypothetical protein KY285_024125 [Solanum tuberosum]|nr:hypothetical protein KY289_024468 [Solanum tuberosum]KAH0676324.1 hypothetical protein KY285_024125 [Solanum tuberosum]